ncbi:hypothetical protein ACFQ08_19265, partial [Streptosporangium algeriense]
RLLAVVGLAVTRLGRLLTVALLLAVPLLLTVVGLPVGGLGGLLAVPLLLPVIGLAVGARPALLAVTRLGRLLTVTLLAVPLLLAVVGLPVGGLLAVGASAGLAVPGLGLPRSGVRL